MDINVTNHLDRARNCLEGARGKGSYGSICIELHIHIYTHIHEQRCIFYILTQGRRRQNHFIYEMGGGGGRDVWSPLNLSKSFTLIYPHPHTNTQLPKVSLKQLYSVTIQHGVDCFYHSLWHVPFQKLETLHCDVFLFYTAWNHHFSV